MQRHLREEIAGATQAFGELVERIRGALARWPFLAVAEGLIHHDDGLLLVILTGAFGDVVERTGPAYQLVGQIRPKTDRQSGPSAPYLNEALHTDSSDWPEPNDLTCLYCVCSDNQGGGLSRLLPVDWARDDLRCRGGATMVGELERSTVPWRLADEMGGGVAWLPVFDGTSMRWLLFTIERALAEGASPPAFPVESVRRLEASLADPSRVFEFMLRPGELLLVNNRRCLHARSSIADPLNSPRSLLRTKVLRPRAWGGALPRSWSY